MLAGVEKRTYKGNQVRVMIVLYMLPQHSAGHPF